jgi:phage gp46-like protein
MAGKQVAPEVKGEFSKGNESLQDLQELSTEVIVDLTEYP